MRTVDMELSHSKCASFAITINFMPFPDLKPLSSKIVTSRHGRVAIARHRDRLSLWMA